MAQQTLDEDRSDERRLTFFQHLEELRTRLKVVVLGFLIVFIIVMTFGFQPVSVSQTSIWLPLPTADQGKTIPAQFIRLMNQSLVQGSAVVVVLTPWEAVISQLKVAMFLAAVISSPLTTYEFWRFVAPALRPSERRLIIRISTPVVALFVAGVLVSLLVILPFTFPFLYGFAFSFGAQPFLSLEEFLDFVLLFSLAFGLAFELPVIMYGLSYLGIVNPEFWKRNWRFAMIGIFIFAAVITPDGSGVTMMLVAVPMLFLYLGGYVAVARRAKRIATRAKSS